jgi:hypothetical protein
MSGREDSRAALQDRSVKSTFAPPLHTDGFIADRQSFRHSAKLWALVRKKGKEKDAKMGQDLFRA